MYASAGCEFRQFDGNRNSYATPVFEVGVTHHPFEGTTINLAAGRRIYNSGFLPNQDFADTYVVGRFQQRLFHRLYFGLGGGYENSDYFATNRNVSAPRNDDYWFIEPSLDVLITRWLSAGVYYLHREDTSNISFFSFDDNQVGSGCQSCSRCRGCQAFCRGKSLRESEGHKQLGLRVHPPLPGRRFHPEAGRVRRLVTFWVRTITSASRFSAKTIYAQMDD